MIISVLVFFAFIPHIKTEQICYAENSHPYMNFSTKTSYDVNAARNINVMTNCIPIYIWGLIRHGTRYNSLKSMKSMQKLYELKDQILYNHEKIKQGFLCEMDLNNLKTWSLDLNESWSYKLTQQGYKELYNLAKKLKNTFPELLSQKKSAFDFQASETERTQSSAVAFTNGLFDTLYNDITGNNIKINSTLLHLNKFCDGYMKENSKNDQPKKQLELFRNTRIMNSLISNVSTRLGFTKKLGFDDIILMHESCAFENAWYSSKKPAFCAAFAEDELKVLEYDDDLDNYWNKGYGNPLQKKLGCTLVRSIITNLNENSESNKHKASFYFSHSEMLLPVYVYLGMFKDNTALRFDNYETLKLIREWRMSRIDGFGSNLVVVLNKCQNNLKKENQVVFYVNGHETILPGCKSNPCALNDVNAILKDAIDPEKCNLDFCIAKSSYLVSSIEMTISFSFVTILSLLFLKLGCWI